MNQIEQEMEEAYKDWITTAFFPPITKVEKKVSMALDLSDLRHARRQEQIDKTYIKIHHPILSRIPFITQNYGPCLGLTLFKLGRYKLELWFAPADYKVELHIHPNSDGEFFVIYGKNREIYKAIGDTEIRPNGISVTPLKKYNLSDRRYWNTLTVRHNEKHGFSKGSTTMIWLCLEKWKPGSKITSVSQDIKF